MTWSALLHLRAIPALSSLFHEVLCPGLGGGLVVDLLIQRLTGGEAQEVLCIAAIIVVQISVVGVDLVYIEVAEFGNGQLVGSDGHSMGVLVNKTLDGRPEGNTDKPGRTSPR